MYYYTLPVFSKLPLHFPPKMGPVRTFATWVFFLKSVIGTEEVHSFA